MSLGQILSNLSSAFAADSVAVFTQDFDQVFKSARALKAVIKENSRVMDHPLENGSMITDHRIILPIEIELTLILSSLDYQDVYKTIKQFYTNGTLLIVQTKSDIYENQLISAMPHEEDPEQYNVLPVILTLRQVQFAQPEYGVVPKAPKNSSNVDRGVVQSSPATPAQESVVFQGLGLRRLGL